MSTSAPDGSLPALTEVVRCLAATPSVAAVALVGSRVAGGADPGSDFDIFVYMRDDVGEVRSRMADDLADPAAWRSVGETAFGDGDVWRLRDSGDWLDLMYWPTAWGEGQLRRVLVEHTASMGYSTAFWRSIRDARPLYERDGWHAELQARARQPYPEPLCRNIVRLNHPYLRDHPFSYRHQAAKAIERHDIVSVNHRVAAWLASYVDIVFAINHVLHPGEKRLLEHLARECPILPDGLASSVDRLVRVAGRAEPAVLDDMDRMVDGLECVLRREGLLPA